jgi:hypothetical protein
MESRLASRIFGICPDRSHHRTMARSCRILIISWAMALISASEPQLLSVFDRFEQIVEVPQALAGIPDVQIHDAYDADRDGEFIRLTARFELDGESMLVPGFAMRDDSAGAWRWHYRWSPARAGTWTRATTWEGKTRLGSAVSIERRLEPIVVAANAAAIGPLVSANELQPAYLRQLSGDGSTRAIWLFGACRAWVTGSRDMAGVDWSACEWIDRDSELFPLMREHGFNLLNQWLAPWEFQFMHADRAEFWSESGTWGRHPIPKQHDWSPYRCYDQGRAAAFDRLVSACGEARDGQGNALPPIYLLLSPLPHQCLQSSQHAWGAQESGWSPEDDGGKQGKERLNGFSAFRPGMTVWDFFAADPRQPADDWRSQLFDHQANYYRYLIARWGFSRAIGAWVLIDELDAIGDTAGSILDRSGWWAHPECDRWLSDVMTLFRGGLRRGDGMSYDGDPFRHPLHAATTSFSDGIAEGGNIDWDGGSAKPDLFGFQWYPLLDGDSWADRWRETIQGVLRYQLPAKIGAPRLISEFGAPDRKTPDDRPSLLYPGIYHFAIWPAIMSGHAGTPMDWDDGKEFGELRWRERPGPFAKESYPVDLAGQMSALRLFLGDLEPDRIRPCAGAGDGVRCIVENDTIIAAMRESNTRVIGWLADFTGQAAFSVEGLLPGEYALQWYDPWTGQAAGDRSSIAVANSAVRIDAQPALDAIRDSAGKFGTDSRFYRGNDLAFKLQKVDR